MEARAMVGWTSMAADPATVARLLDDLPYPVHLSAVDDGSYSWIAANDAVLRLLGRAREDVVGRPLADIIPDEDAAATMRARRDEVAATLVPASYELTLQLPSGPRSYAATLVPIRNDRGECTHVFGIWNDATAQRQIEARSRAILEATPDVVVTVRRDGTLVTVDGQVVRLLHSPAGALDQRIPDIYPPEATERIMRLITGALDTGELHTDEIHVDFDGVELLLEARVVPLGPDLALGIGRDITERKAADEALRHSEQRFRLLATDAPVGIFQTDAAGRCLFVNSYWSDRAGIEPEHALGDGWTDAVHPDDRDRVRDEWDRATASGHDFDLEYRFRTPDGVVSWLIGHAVPLRDELGAITGYLGTVLDISERHQAEQLRVARVEAEQLVSAISRRVLTASVHDIDAVIVETLGDIGRFTGACAAAIQRYPEAGARSERTHSWFDESMAHLGDIPREESSTLWLVDALAQVDLDHLVIDLHELPDLVTSRSLDALRSGGVHALGFLPVRSGGRLSGFLALSWSEPVRPAVEVLLPTLRVLGDVVIAALDRTRTERERIEADQALRHSEERFRALVQNSSDMVTVLDAEGVVQYTSPASRTILGLDSADQTGGLGFDRVHPDDREAIQRVFAEALERPGPTEAVQLRLRHEDGTWRTIEAVGTNLLHDPAVAGLVVNGRDVTERVRLEEHFRALVQNTSDMITVLDAEGRIVYASPAAETVLGWPIPEWIGRQVFELVHPEDLERVAARFAEAVAEEGLTEPVEFRMRRPDGSWCHIEGIGNSLFRDPSVRGMVVTARDVTDRKRLEEQLLHAQKMEAVGQLAGGVAHDFNNLLTAITGYTALLLDSTGHGDPRREDLEEIASAGARATALVDQLLSFSRRQMVQPAELDLGEVVESMRSLIDRLLPADIEVVTELAEELAPVEADRSKLEQVLMNLVVNARDAMRDGGRLVIETANARLDEEYAATHLEVVPGEYAMLALSDDGVGMDAETRARVFEPFFTTKDVGQGTGLGLSTIYGIVKQAGGHVAVYSEPGRGTTFRVYLPCVDPRAEARPGEQAPVAERVGGTETILLVEDEAAVRTLASQALSRLGYSVLDTTDGQEALEIAETHQGPIDLLLTDVVLPRVGGVEVAEKLTADRPDLRVLFTSGYTEAALVHERAAGGVDHFLPKPFQVADLARRVREVLDGAPRA